MNSKILQSTYKYTVLEISILIGISNHKFENITFLNSVSF
jgi:hypothetical protein